MRAKYSGNTIWNPAVIEIAYYRYRICYVERKQILDFEKF